MRVPSIVGAIGAIILAAALGCGPKPVSRPDPATLAPCAVLLPFTESAETVTVALFDGVDPHHAPIPQNDAELLVFAHLYDRAFIGNECTVQPGLVDGSVGIVVAHDRATLTLRRDARFWDGTPVTSQDVVNCLARPNHSELDSIIVVDERRFSVMSRDRAGVELMALYSPTFAVTKTSETLWPTGAGRYRVIDASNPHGILVRSVSDNLPVVRFYDARGVDIRDLLDPFARPAVDLMIVDDPFILDYARAEGRFREVMLAKSRAYVLLSVVRARDVEGGGLPPALPVALRTDLAHNAVRHAFAEPLRGSEWTSGFIECVGLAEMEQREGKVRSPARILFDKSDSTARDLADRIVSLAVGGGSTSAAAAIAKAIPGIGASNVAAAGVDRAELALSLTRGDDFAYIVSLPYKEPDTCGMARALVEKAPWLGGHANLSAKLVPLVATWNVALVSNRGAGFGFDLRHDEYNNLVVVPLPQVSRE